MPASVFISYSGDRDTVAQIATALRQHGMRPWRDADNLPLGARTLEQIRAELATCRAAMIWLTRPTLESDYVTRIELPAVFDEQERRGLDIIPVFVDWTPGSDASTAVREAVGREIGDLNGHVWDRSNRPADEAARLARRYAASALSQLASESNTRPLVRCATRTDAAPNRDTAHINLDWRPEYPSDGRLPPEATVHDLRRSLSQVADEAIAAFGAGEVMLALRCHLHVGIAIGHAFRRPTGLIPKMLIDGQAWTAEIVPTDSAYALRSRQAAPGPAGGTRASVEISISQDVARGVDQTVASTGAVYATRVKLDPPRGPSQTSLPDSTTANAWSQQAASVIADLRNRPGITDLDLYLSAPLQFAVMLGWRLNVAGAICLHHWQQNTGPYREVWTLPPS